MSAVNTTVNEAASEIIHDQSTREIDGANQGPPRLTKNYSLNTIFERKKQFTKDFIKNNIRYVNKLSSKLNRNKVSHGSISARGNPPVQKSLRKNASNGSIKNLNSVRPNTTDNSIMKSQVQNVSSRLKYMRYNIYL